MKGSTPPVFSNTPEFDLSRNKPAIKVGPVEVGS
jgi:hypothetical protein